MPALDARTRVLAAGGIGLLLAGIVGLASLDAERLAVPEPAARTAPSPGRANSLSDPHAPTARAPAGRAPAEPWSPDDAIAAVSRRYREAEDLRGFYRRAVETGGMAHLWFAQTALLRCYQVARFGLVGAEQRFASLGASEEIDAARKEAHRGWIQPCSGFETNPLPPGEAQRLNARLRELPGLVGDAYRLETGKDPADAERRSLMRSIVESGEGDLIGTFGTGVADLRFGPWRYEKDAGALESNRSLIAEQRAWMLAGCELGMDCARGSIAWYNACVKSGDCSDGNAAQEAAAEAGRDALPAILKRRDEIVAAVRARDWKTLGL